MKSMNVTIDAVDTATGQYQYFVGSDRTYAVALTDDTSAALSLDGNARAWFEFFSSPDRGGVRSACIPVQTTGQLSIGNAERHLLPRGVYYAWAVYDYGTGATPSKTTGLLEFCEILSGGQGYTAPPTITLTAQTDGKLDSPVATTGDDSLAAHIVGPVLGWKVSNGGRGYTSGAPVTFSYSSLPDGVALPIATLVTDTYGTVTGIAVSNPTLQGAGYGDAAGYGTSALYASLTATLPPPNALAQASVTVLMTADGMGIVGATLNSGGKGYTSNFNVSTSQLSVPPTTNPSGGTFAFTVDAGGTVTGVTYSVTSTPSWSSAQYGLTLTIPLPTGTQATLTEGGALINGTVTAVTVSHGIDRTPFAAPPYAVASAPTLVDATVKPTTAVLQVKLVENNSMVATNPAIFTVI